MRKPLSFAIAGLLIFAGAFILAAVDNTMIPIPQGEPPSKPFRAIATWAYKFSSSSQVDDFVQKAADAGYTHIWCFNGWAGPDGSYTNAENAGGINIASTDPYLAPLVMGDSGSQLVKSGHARGMKVIAFESIFDMYGCKGKKEIDAGGYWVANPDGSFTNWDWTGVYARLLRTVFPD